MCVCRFSVTRSSKCRWVKLRQLNCFWCLKGVLHLIQKAFSVLKKPSDEKLNAFKTSKPVLLPQFNPSTHSYIYDYPVLFFLNPLHSRVSITHMYIYIYVCFLSWTQTVVHDSDCPLIYTVALNHRLSSHRVPAHFNDLAVHSAPSFLAAIPSSAKRNT